VDRGRAGAVRTILAVVIALAMGSAVLLQGGDPVVPAPAVTAPTTGPTAPQAPPEHEALFDSLLTLMQTEYIPVGGEPVDWAAVAQRYRPLIQQSADRLALERTLRLFLAEFDDGHLFLDLPAERGARPPITLEPDGDQIVMSGVDADSEAEAAGLTPGMRLITVDGQPAEVARQAFAALISSSTPAHNRWASARNLLRGPVGTSVTLTARSGDGREIEATLERQVLPGPTGSGFEFRRLEGNIAYMKIRTFDGDRIIQQALDAMAEMAANPPAGLIIDVRENGGGRHRFQLADHLFAEPTLLLRDRWHRAGSWREHWSTPATAIYAGPLLLLTNPGCTSACDSFAAWVQQTGRGKLVGEPTSGAARSVEYYDLPMGYVVGITGEIESYGINGQSLEGNPPQPDYPVAPTAADFAAGRDPVLAKAISLLHP